MDPKSAQFQSNLTSQPGDKSQTVKASNNNVSTAGLGSKEFESGFGLGGLEIPELKEIGRDIELPKEVAQAGVRVTPTTVTVSPSLQKIGMKGVGTASQPTGTTAMQSIPLTDDEIAQGLSQSIMSSWRWLSEWCIRKLKQLHNTVTKVGGR